MNHRVARWEIAATDLRSTKKFYSKLFDWSIGEENPDKFAVIRTGNGIDGLIFLADPGTPTFVTFYVEVDDCEAYLRKAETLGGTIYVPPTPSPVEGEKEFGVFGDPEGNVVGVVTKG
jgi:hypothetical protein